MMTERNAYSVSPLRRFASAAGAVVIAAATVVAFGCGDDEPQEAPPPQTYDFPIEVEATDGDDQPVAGVPVLIDDERVGFTDADGQFEARLHEAVLTDIHLAVDEPEGYRLTGENTSVEQTLRVAESFDGEHRGIPVTLRPELRSTLHEYLVWLAIECDDDLDDEYCEDVPVLLDDDPITQTDSRGHAHFTFESTPGELHELLIDISPSGADDDAPEIEPHDPVYELETTTGAVVFHITEEFTDPDAEPDPPPRRAPRPRPQQQAEPEPEPQQEEPKQQGPIQLF